MYKELERYAKQYKVDKKDIARYLYGKADSKEVSNYLYNRKRK